MGPTGPVHRLMNMMALGITMKQATLDHGVHKKGGKRNSVSQGQDAGRQDEGTAGFVCKAVLER